MILTQVTPNGLVSVKKNFSGQIVAVILFEGSVRQEGKDDALITDVACRLGVSRYPETRLGSGSAG